jgi:hypothetical protein
MDPLSSPDTHKARAALEDAEFACLRLRTLIPRLERRFEELSKREAEAAWTTGYDALKPRRDELDEKIRSTYAAFAGEMIPRLRQAELLNAEIAQLLLARPSRAYEDRDDRILAAVPTLDGLKLSDPSKSGAMLWPEAVSYFHPGIVSAFKNPGADWHVTMQAARDRVRADDHRKAEAIAADDARICNDQRLWK